MQCGGGAAAQPRHIHVQENEGGTGLEKRTVEWIRKKAEERGLRIGAKVRIETMRTDGKEAFSKVYRSGTVTGIYPYIFSCQIGRNVACFRYNQIIGNEIVERVMING